MIAFGFLALLVAAVIWAINREKRLWNNGLCAKYHEPWELFDTDSQGGRGYKCRDIRVWISWPVDRLPKSSSRAV